VETGVQYTLITSQFGAVSLVWAVLHNELVIRRVVLPREGTDTAALTRAQFPTASKSRRKELQPLCRDIQRLLEGEDVELSLDFVGWLFCSPFQRRVLLMEKEIPRGRVSTYGRLAQKLGHPRAARAVGSALARNPFPLIIPCHRAIRSDGTLGGFQGGLAMKRTLLQMEGIAFDEKGRVLPEQIW